jgi:hypothetical protein
MDYLFHPVQECPIFLVVKEPSAASFLAGHWNLFGGIKGEVIGRHPLLTIEMLVFGFGAYRSEPKRME